MSGTEARKKRSTEPRTFAKNLKVTEKNGAPSLSSSRDAAINLYSVQARFRALSCTSRTGAHASDGITLAERFTETYQSDVYEQCEVFFSLKRTRCSTVALPRNRTVLLAMVVENSCARLIVALIVLADDTLEYSHFH